MHENNPRVSLKAAAEVLGVNRTTLRTWADTYGTGTKTKIAPVRRADRAKQLTDAEKMASFSRKTLG